VDTPSEMKIIQFPTEVKEIPKVAAKDKPKQEKSSKFSFPSINM
jgi:hypothetical protein